MNYRENIMAKGIGIGGEPANMSLFDLRNDDSYTSVLKAHQTLSPTQASKSNPALEKLAESKKLLMLQGPIGPMFDRIADWKKSHKANCYRIAFNAGDALHSRALEPINYVGRFEDWDKYLHNFLISNEIDAVLLFGQSRKYHVAAAKLCRTLKITLLVMEEGYIRPGFVTLELDGVNGHSSTLSKFSLAAESTPNSAKTYTSGHTQFASVSLHAITYYAALVIGKNKFPLYQHHREANPLPHIRHWLKSTVKKITRSMPDKSRVEKLKIAPPYFFVPLQLDTDAQVINHSDFESCINFLQMVMRSFAENSAKNTLLVIKQHPLARGESNAEKFTLSHAKSLGIKSRVIFLYEGHIPTLIRHADGVVTINSTVGLQAIYQKKPLKVLGNAIYENELVTDSKPLHQFWQSPMKPNETAAKNLYASIKILTQAPAAIYASRSVQLNWPEPRRVNASL